MANGFGAGLELLRGSGLWTRPGPRGGSRSCKGAGQTPLKIRIREHFMAPLFAGFAFIMNAIVESLARFADGLPLLNIFAGCIPAAIDKGAFEAFHFRS